MFIALGRDQPSIIEILTSTHQAAMRTSTIAILSATGLLEAEVPWLCARIRTPAEATAQERLISSKEMVDDQLAKHASLESAREAPNDDAGTVAEEVAPAEIDPLTTPAVMRVNTWRTPSLFAFMSPRKIAPFDPAPVPADMKTFPPVPPAPVAEPAVMDTAPAAPVVDLPAWRKSPPAVPPAEDPPTMETKPADPESVAPPYSRKSPPVDEVALPPTMLTLPAVDVVEAVPPLI
jgi:hypothetical protein